jgi:hypothetical protein
MHVSSRIRTAKRSAPDGDLKFSDTERIQPTAYGRNATTTALGIGYVSGRETFVAMMQAADLRDSQSLSDPARHDRAGVGTILVERKMRAGASVGSTYEDRTRRRWRSLKVTNVIQTHSRRIEPITRST